MTVEATAPPVLRHRFRAMGTDVHAIVVGGTTGHLERIEREVRDRERRWSRFLAESELSIVNANAGRPVVVSADTFELVAAALDANARSGGRFDPTILGTLVAAGYDRSLDLIRTATPGREGSARERDGSVLVEHVPAPTPVGIELNEALTSIQLPPGVGLDLGGIAKGATADVVVDVVLADGAAGCCLNLGGDLRVAGESPRSGGWVVELECPGADRTVLVRMLDGAVCTSTTLLRRWNDGEEHHLRDPGTGRPLATGLVSATVIAGRARSAEVLTKVALAAGPDLAPGELEELRATGLLVGDDGTITQLAGLDRYLVGAGADA